MTKLFAVAIAAIVASTTALAQSEGNEPENLQDKVVEICRQLYPRTAYTRSTVSTYISNGEASATINCYYKVPKK